MSLNSLSYIHCMPEREKLSSDVRPWFCYLSCLHP